MTHATERIARISPASKATVRAYPGIMRRALILMFTAIPSRVALTQRFFKKIPVLPKVDCHKTANHHKAVIELVCYSHEFVLSLQQKQNENIHLSILGCSPFATIGPLVDPHEQPHPENVEHYMNVTHIVFVDIIIR